VSITGNFDNPIILAVETSGRLGSVALAQGDKLLSEARFSGPMRHSAEIFPAITGLLNKIDKKPNQIEHIYISAGPGSFTGLRIAVTLAKTMALANNSKIAAVDTLDVIAANAATDNTELFSHRGHREHREKINECRAGLAPPIMLAERLAVVLDAKRGQFFIAVYEQIPDPRPQTPDTQSDLSLRAERSNLNQLKTKNSKLKTDFPFTKILNDSLMTAEEFIARFTYKPIVLIGEGLVFYKDKFTNPNVSFLEEKFWNPSAANVHKLGWQLALQNQFADPLTLTPNYIRGPDVTVKQR
jgi:tRNA threonylcarbamoyl adenosine modification protein YeaZ